MYDLKYTHYINSQPDSQDEILHKKILFIMTANICYIIKYSIMIASSRQMRYI